MKILVVDDDRSIVKTACDILNLKGHDAIAAFSGEEAVEMARTHSPSCVLMDLNMPGVSGIDALKRIRANAPSLPVILASGFASDAISREAQQHGALAVLSKPYNFQRLLAFVSLLTKQESILVVDDDPLFCSAMTRLLGARGFHVESQTDPGKVLDHLQHRYVLLVLLDLNLGTTNGVNVLQTIRHHYRTKPVMLVTAYAEEMPHLVADGLRFGAHRVFKKPLEIDALTDAIHRVRYTKLQHLLRSA